MDTCMDTCMGGYINTGSIRSGDASEVLGECTGPAASQDLSSMREPNLQALKAELKANGMFVHAEHVCELTNTVFSR